MKKMMKKMLFMFKKIVMETKKYAYELSEKT